MNGGVFFQGGRLGAAKRQMGRVQKLIENGEKAVERAEKELCQGGVGRVRFGRAKSAERRWDESRWSASSRVRYFGMWR